MIKKITKKSAAVFLAIGIMISTNGVGTLAQNPSIQWTELATLDFNVNAMFTSGAILFAGTEGGGIYRSNNGGQSWAPSNTGLPAGLKVRAFEIIGMSLFIGTDKGAYRSNDQGQNWTEVNTGLTYNAGSTNPPRSIPALLAIGSNLFAGAGKVDGVSGVTVSIFRSDNLGQNWTQVNNGLPAISSCSGFAYGIPGFFAATDAGVYRSADNGQNWISASFQSATSLAVIGQNIFGLRREGVWRSSDQGLTWSRVFQAAEGKPGGAMINVISSGANLFTIDEFVYTLTSNFPRVSYSNDTGQNWYDTEVPNFEISPVIVTTIHISGDRLFAARADRKLFVRAGFYSPGIATFSAASYFDRAFGSESISTAFGANLSSTTLTARSLPLPTTLGGTEVKVKDAQGVERDAQLFYVSSTQVNFQIPPNTANGGATVTIKSNGQMVGTGQILIQQVAPGLFAANANGYGVAAAVLLRIRDNGTLQYEDIAEFDSVKREYIPKPIDFSSQTDRLFLVLFGTGIKGRSSLSRVRVISDGPDLPVIYAGPQGDYVGLDQVNVQLSRSLIGRGELFFYLDVDSVPSNVLIVSFK